MVEHQLLEERQKFGMEPHGQKLLILMLEDNMVQQRVKHQQPLFQWVDMALDPFLQPQD